MTPTATQMVRLARDCWPDPYYADPDGLALDLTTVEAEAVAAERERLAQITPDLFRLRLSLIEGSFVPELRCPHCTQWLIVDTENWEKDEWHMCLACKRMRAKLYAALRQRDAEYRTQKAEKSRRYRKWLKETYPQYIQAYDRERKALGRARARAYREQQKEGNHE